MRLYNDLASRSARLIFALLITWVWCGGHGWAQSRTGDVPDAAPPASGPPPADQVERWFDAVDAAARELDAQTFDPGAILARVGPDPEALLAWVRDSTYWVPYAGCLRGGRGVLMDRLGNSLDRSLLLAELLSRAGHSVRLARAQLSEQRANELLAGVKPVPVNWLAGVGMRAGPGGPRAASGEAPPVDGASAAAAVDIIAESARLAEDAAERVHSQSQWLRGLVKAPPPPDDRSAATARVEAARDHWWVQRQQGQAWLDLDPMMGVGGGVARAAEPTATIPAVAGERSFELPPEACHRVRISVVTEQWSNGKLLEKQPLTHVLRPGEVAGRRVTLDTTPLNWSNNNLKPGEPGAADRFAKSAAAQKEWLPALTIGKERIVQSSFTDNGELNDKPQPNPAAQFGQSAGRALGGFGGALGGGGNEAPRQTDHLTAVWVEFEVMPTGQAPRKVRRTVFDLIGPAARAAGTVAAPVIDDAARATRGLALLGDTQVVPLVCHPSPEFVYHVIAAQLAESKPAALELARLGPDADFETVMHKLGSVRQTDGILWAVALARQAWSPWGGVVYLDQPNLLTYQRRPRLSPDGKLLVREGCDIVENAVSVLEAGGADAFQVRLEQGVADTVAEGILMARLAPTENASEVVVRAPAQGVKWRAATAAEELAAPQFDLPPDALARIRQDLQPSNHVVAPASAVEIGGRSVVAWWRVDTKTGQTIGLAGNSEGAGMAEYVVTFVSAVTAVLAFYGCGAGPEASTGKNVACGVCALAAYAMTFIFLWVVFVGALGAVGVFITGTGGGLAGIGIGNVCNAIGWKMK